jgi:hypothetical protein
MSNYKLEQKRRRIGAPSDRYDWETVTEFGHDLDLKNEFRTESEAKEAIEREMVWDKENLRCNTYSYRIVEDPYEYAVQSIRKLDGNLSTILRHHWGSLDNAESYLKTLTVGVGGDHYLSDYDFKLVKRRKAGPVEDV